MAAGVEGLLRDKSRPSRIAPLKPDVVERVVALTLTDAPGETTHWTAPAMAKLQGIQREFGATGLAPAWLAAAPHAPRQAFQRP